MPSDIKVTALSAIGGAGVITLSAVVASPAGMGCLPYMQAAKIEYWSSSANDRSSAAKIGESTGVLAHGGLSANQTRYYWARAVDPAGNTGDFYPVSTTGGVAATTLSTQPGPNSVGTTELQNNAVTAAKMSVGQLSAITADLGTINAGTINGINIYGSFIAGGVVQTSNGVDAVRMDGSQNEFAVYRGGSKIARIGYTPGGTVPAIMSVNEFSGATGVSVYSSGGSAVSAMYAYRVNSGVGLYGANASSGSYAHGLRGENLSGGGLGYVGVGPADGGYGLFAARGGVGPFTGAHDALIAIDDPAVPGDLVCDVRVIARNGWDDTLTIVESASETGQRGVVGVISARFDFDPDSDFASWPVPETGDRATFLRKHLAGRYQRVRINSVGEGQLLVCGRGGDLAKGDLLCASSMRGKGERQNTAMGAADDIVRGWTAARAREAVSFDGPDQVKRVACIYLCG